jgi:trimethylamine--corrinoid protein Co-methyltransferase
MGSAQDVPAKAAELSEMLATITNTSKPIVFLSYSPRGAELVYEMASEVAGGLDNLRRKPFLIFYPEPISPLVWPAEVVDRTFVAADLRMPQMFGPSIQPGGTAPVTMAAAVALAVAETLAGIILAQLRSPGCPVGLGCNFGILDMSTAMMSVGLPEMSLGLAAQAQVAQYLGLPTWGLAGATDSKVVDAQAGVESMFSVLTQGLAGLNLIHDVGYVDRGMACSVEQLVLGNDVIGMAKRFMTGMTFSNEELARDLIEEVGPGGHYMQQMHTFEHFKTTLWRGRVFDRFTHSQWVQKGSKTTEDRVREEIRRIVDTHQPTPLPDKTLAALEDIKKRGEAELTKDDA